MWVLVTVVGPPPQPSGSAPPRSPSHCTNSGPLTVPKFTGLGAEILSRCCLRHLRNFSVVQCSVHSQSTMQPLLAHEWIFKMIWRLSFFNSSISIPSSFLESNFRCCRAKRLPAWTAVWCCEAFFFFYNTQHSLRSLYSGVSCSGTRCDGFDPPFGIPERAL